MTDNLRLQQLTQWVHQKSPLATIKVASADASFRRYFRITEGNNTTIVMDALPELEDCAPFIDITNRLQNANVHAPKILRKNLKQGFLQLEDFGSDPYLSILNEKTADKLYADALNALIKLQQANTDNLPEYNDSLLNNEMQLMPEWFLKKHLGINLTPEQERIIDRTLNVISKTVLQQPQVFVHRDFHSRNLMVLEEKNPGIIDYQDAVLGPITYDLVSLLRDCYIKWPNEKMRKWAFNYKKLAEKENILNKVSDSTFIQWFDYMGLQRHIKVLGIFSRLSHRDGKTSYLNDLPLTLHYVMEVGKKYPLIRPLVELFNTLEIPNNIKKSTSK